MRPLEMGQKAVARQHQQFRGQTLQRQRTQVRVDVLMSAHGIDRFDATASRMAARRLDKFHRYEAAKEAKAVDGPDPAKRRQYAFAVAK